MLNGANKNNDQKIFSSLLSDLKRPLVLIAREAEAERLNSEISLKSIQQTAERTLLLIDSYILASQSEYGQQHLPIEPFGVGSVIYNVATDIRPLAREAKVDVLLNINDGLVAVNQQGLKATIWCLADMILASTIAAQNSGVIEINAKKSADIVRIAVLSRSVNIKDSDLKRAKEKIGKSHMAFSSTSFDSGIRLTIASLLGESMGAKLKAVRTSRGQGVGFNLSLSKQLQLV